jgi:mRNA interferase RelE/StbE
VGLSYRVGFRPAAERALKKLRKANPSEAERIRGAILLLAADPRPPASRPLARRPGWRVRVGDHRVIYTIDDGLLLIAGLALGRRRETYR